MSHSVVAGFSPSLLLLTLCRPYIGAQLLGGMDDNRVLNAVLDDMVRFTMLLNLVLPKEFMQSAARLRAARPSFSAVQKVRAMRWRRLEKMTYNLSVVFGCIKLISIRYIDCKVASPTTLT